ncbi:hypothetical protein [Urechidicola croceus]|nr:hypothetical protein [Urechidicola croceus]
MTLISFIFPTDKDILRDLKEESQTINFIGEGSISQNVEETKFYRNFKYRFDKENTIRQVVYFKKGLMWEFKRVISIQNNGEIAG